VDITASPGRHKIIPPKPLLQRTPIHAKTPGAQPPSNHLMQKVQDKGPLTPTDVMTLQRTVGNQAVQRMLGEQEAPLVNSKSQDVSRPLSSEVRTKMEQSFGTSFGNVQIHQGDQADAMGARAYAQGPNIYVQRSINLNGYEGQKVLAHELAHVVQQRTGRVTNSPDGPTINDNPQLETEAHRAANKAANGAPAGLVGSKSMVQRTSTNVIQRWPWNKKNKSGVSKAQKKQAKAQKKDIKKQAKQEYKRQQGVKSQQKIDFWKEQGIF
jgi:hypothetical protein